MYSDPKFGKEQAHAQHVHFWQMTESSRAGVGFSFEADTDPPSDSVMRILVLFGLTIDDFELVNGKHRLSIKRFWHIYGSTLEYVEKERFNIGIKIANAIINCWRN
jgi:hypothetical protein